eukprot:373931_1
MLSNEENEDQTDKAEEKKENPKLNEGKNRGDFPTCDIYELFNALQFAKYGNSFIDIRSQNEYKQQSAFEAVNVAQNILNHNECDKILKELLKELKLQNSANSCSLSTIYFFSNRQRFETGKDLKFYTYFNNMNEMKNISIIILNTDFNTFYLKFPYLCCSEKKRNELFEAANGMNGKYEIRITYPTHILNNKLYLGGMNCANTKYILKNLKITHILNMTMQRNVFIDDDELNIKYLQCPLWDIPVEPIENYFEKGIQFIYNALDEKNENGNIQNNKVLVHCRGGVSRSSTIIIAYLMKIHKMKYINAYKYTKKKREIIEPNDGFAQQLKNYQKNGYIVKQKKPFKSADRIVWQ